MGRRRTDVERGAEELTVAELEELRAIVVGWHVSAGAIGVRSWHERLDGDGQPGPPIRWLRPLLAAAVAAVGLALVMAVGAALLLTRPAHPSSAGGSTTPAGAAGKRSLSPTPAATASAAPIATPLPSLFTAGPSITPRDLLVVGLQTQVLALPDGRLEPLTAPASPGGIDARILPLPDGTYVCVCATDVATPGRYTREVSLRVEDAQGATIRTFAGGTFVGLSDPKLDGPEASSTAALSADAASLLLVHATLGAEGWQVGMNVVDLARGTQRQRLDLGTVPSPASGAALIPTIEVAPDGRQVIVGLRSVANGMDVGAPRWSATFTAGRLSAPLDFPGDIDDPGCLWSGWSGFVSPSLYLVQCGYGTNSWLRRVDLAGRSLGDVPLPGDFGQAGLRGTAVDPTSGTWYGWDPFSGRLVRVDAARGVTTGSVLVPKASARSADPLTLLGRWLVPTALAKVDLDPSIALAPDGRRLYLIGSTASSFTENGRSTGVLVVDPRSLAVIDRWAAPADLSSLAVSRDGTLVYALAGPGDWQQASLTVFDAATGQVRLIAGRLGSDWLAFPEDVPVQP